MITTIELIIFSLQKELTNKIYEQIYTYIPTFFNRFIEKHKKAQKSAINRKNNIQIWQTKTNKI
jgi:hypothetical protein